MRFISPLLLSFTLVLPLVAAAEPFDVKNWRTATMPQPAAVPVGAEVEEIGRAHV